MTEIISETTPIISYDPASCGGDLSAVLVIERQTVTVIKDFENPTSFPRYRVLMAADLKGMEYHKQIAELEKIVQNVKTVYQRDPVVLVDSTGNEGLSDSLRLVFPNIYLMKFVGDMIREKGHSGKFRTINKPVWVQKLALYLESNQIVIDKNMPQARTIRKQLEQFAGKVRVSGSVAYEAGGGGKDDFISCILLALNAPDGYSYFDLPQGKSPSFYSGANKPLGYS